MKKLYLSPDIPAVLHQVGNAVDEHRGLAATRPRQQQKRTLRGQHRLPLLLVQARKALGDHIPAHFDKSLFLFVIEHVGYLSFLSQCPYSITKPPLRSTAPPYFSSCPLFSTFQKDFYSITGYFLKTDTIL